MKFEKCPWCSNAAIKLTRSANAKQCVAECKTCNSKLIIEAENLMDAFRLWNRRAFLRFLLNERYMKVLPELSLLYADMLQGDTIEGDMIIENTILMWNLYVDAREMVDGPGSFVLQRPMASDYFCAPPNVVAQFLNGLFEESKEMVV